MFLATKMPSEYISELAQALFAQLHSHEFLSLELSGESSEFIRVSRAHVRQAGSVMDAAVELRLYSKQQSGGIHNASFAQAITGNRENDALLLKNGLERLRKTIAQIPADPFSEIPALTAESLLDNSGHAPAAEDFAGSVAAWLETAADLDLTGILTNGPIYRAYFDSLGSRHWFAKAQCLLDYSLFGEGERAVKSSLALPYWQSERVNDSLASARRQLQALARPLQLVKKGEYRTYLAPSAAVEILSQLGGMFSEFAIRQGDSPIRKVRENTAQFSPLVTLTDDYREGLAPRFNERGELSPEHSLLVDQGKFVGTLVSAKTAKEYGIKANGANSSESMRAACLGAGNLAESDILSALGEGLYLANLHYLNWSDQEQGRLTGMTRFACFWVANGELQGPIQNLRWDDSIFRLLGSQLENLSKEVSSFPNTATYEFRSTGGESCPGMLLKGMQFTL